ncbi:MULTISPECIES: hypothetical protein [Methylorubrum]|uniref:DUF1674 domain-containing protein n=1 Tax=Methylorubrum suomiense TaxID=144191 RepID=A0ABQ4UXY8_9HYPH|nr:MULTISPECIES: hypothetical protein [Methylobacteriaceae]GJE76253.1 hypothetical protein BGCPKDLD_2845 [Methylorubrum suomiense]
MDTSEDTQAQRDPAYVEGRAAAERGEGADRNPHSAGSSEYRHWADGHASVTAPDAVADDLADFA